MLNVDGLTTTVMFKPTMLCHVSDAVDVHPVCLCAEVNNHTNDMEVCGLLFHVVFI